ncbi:hypothetical protein, partial [Stenotrophomonas maltophilia]|uniref:hypothetical protein n=1 Tax=Stenotrophomonas maltophilia TaxID=40324 RepID=UPI00296F3220
MSVVSLYVVIRILWRGVALLERVVLLGVVGVLMTRSIWSLWCVLCWIALLWAGPFLRWRWLVLAGLGLVVSLPVVIVSVASSTPVVPATSAIVWALLVSVGILRDVGCDVPEPDSRKGLNGALAVTYLCKQVLNRGVFGGWREQRLDVWVKCL